MKALTSKFEVFMGDPFGLLLPEEEVSSLYNSGIKRVLAKAYYKTNEISFHVAVRKLHGTFVIYFGKRLQKELGLKETDAFLLQFFEDTSKYGVEMPEAFSAVLESDFEAMQRFNELTAGKKRSLIYYIMRFKNEQTQIDKALNISENLKMGITDEKELVKKL